MTDCASRATETTSPTAITLTSATSLVSAMKSFMSGGSTRRTACGTTIRRIAWRLVMPRLRAASVWPRSTDSMPARYTSAM